MGKAISYEHSGYDGQTDRNPQPPVRCRNREAQRFGNPDRCSGLDALHVEAALENDGAAALGWFYFDRFRSLKLIHRFISIA